MRLLLDTQVFLWLRSTPQKLSPLALEQCRDTQNILYLSLVSVWEMQAKFQLGRLKLKMPLRDLIQQQCESNYLQVLPIELRHIFELKNLPLHHNDLFDRLLIAQSHCENAYLVTPDSFFREYQVKLLW